MIIVSVDWRLRSSSSARVLSRKMKYSEFGLLKVFSSMFRFFVFVVFVSAGDRFSRAIRTGWGVGVVSR